MPRKTVHLDKRENCEALIRSFLTEAEAGQVKAVAIAVVYEDGESAHGEAWAQNANLATLTGETVAAVMRLVELSEENRAASPDSAPILRALAPRRRRQARRGRKDVPSRDPEDAGGNQSA